MWQTIFYFVLKVSVGVVFAAWIENMRKTKKNKKMSNRQFDYLDSECQELILENMVALAKQYETIEETGDSIELLATDFGQSYLLTVSDFLLIDVENVVEWGGPRPPKPPRIE